MKQFTKEWQRETSKTGEIIYRPTISLLIGEKDGSLKLYDFLVDSGADISLAPRTLANRIGLDWKKGRRITLEGISKKKVCEVEGRIQRISVILLELDLKIEIPVCFARSNAPLLVGREGFFDYFKVTFDKSKRRCLFELFCEE